MYAKRSDYFCQIKKILNCCTKTLDSIAKYWVICVAVGTAVGLLFFHINPGFYFQHVGFQQQQDNLQEEQINLKNQFVDFHNELGTQFLNEEEIEAARNEFSQALRVDPLNQNATKGLFECDVYSSIFNSSYNPDITKKQLDLLNTTYPNDPLPSLYLGDLYVNFGDITNAKRSYQRAIDMDSSVASAYNGLGGIYDSQNDTSNALIMYKKAYDSAPWNGKYRVNIASELGALGDYKDSNAWIANTSRICPNYVNVYSKYISHLMLLDDFKNASVLQEYQIKLFEDKDIMNMSLNRGDYTHGLRSGKIVSMNHDSEKFYAYYNMALIYYMLGNDKRTLEYVNKANNLTDDDTKLKIKDIINDDIEWIQQYQPQDINKTNAFRNKFLV
jgi:tetratricopeptide (TPR) repeat protein